MLSNAIAAGIGRPAQTITWQPFCNRCWNRSDYRSRESYFRVSNRFFLASVSDEESTKLGEESVILVVHGVLTPTEILSALKSGTEIVKSCLNKKRISN
jgi:hypothetical protein